MIQSISCPNCGAAISAQEGQHLVQCAYCGSSIQLGEPVPALDPLVPDPSLSEVAALYRAGKRVQATIRYREITGAGLKEARIAIDCFASGEPLRRPNRMGR